VAKDQAPRHLRKWETRWGKGNAIRAAARAQFAAARKLACAIWYMLSHSEPYCDPDSKLSDRKVARIWRGATNAAALVASRELESVGEMLTGRAGGLERLAQVEARVG
jgi:hypothetical protein